MTRVDIHKVVILEAVRRKALELEENIECVQAPYPPCLSAEAFGKLKHIAACQAAIMLLSMTAKLN